MSYVNAHQLGWNDMPVTGIAAKDLFAHENGTFKVVKLEPYAKYPIHQHADKTEYAFVIEGVLEAKIGENKYIGMPGAFFTFPVGIKHGLHNPNEKQTVILIGAVKDCIDLGDKKID